MNKTFAYILLFIPAAILAGIYGSIHDQISYSFSVEYFTKFKFIQFNFPWAYSSPRTGASVIGFLATWWMGCIVYSILGLFGFIFPTAKTMYYELLKSFFVVLIVALLTGLGGLIYGYMTLDGSNIAAYSNWIWPNVIDPVQFIRVGFMHNASYIGGLTGLVAGICYLFWRKKVITKTLCGIATQPHK